MALPTPAEVRQRLCLTAAANAAMIDYVVCQFICDMNLFLHDVDKDRFPNGKFAPCVFDVHLRNFDSLRTKVDVALVAAAAERLNARLRPSGWRCDVSASDTTPDQIIAELHEIPATPPPPIYS